MNANYELQCEMRAVALDQFKQIVVKLFPGDSFEDREMRFDMTENINSIVVSKCLFWSVPKLRYLTFDLAMKVEITINLLGPIFLF